KERLNSWMLRLQAKWPRAANWLRRNVSPGRSHNGSRRLVREGRNAKVGAAMAQRNRNDGAAPFSNETDRSSLVTNKVGTRRSFIPDVGADLAPKHPVRPA